MTLSNYLTEHPIAVRSFIIHIAPYLVIFFSSLTMLVGSGWIDLPAQSDDLISLRKEVESLKSAYETDHRALEIRLRTIEIQQQQLVTTIQGISRETTGIRKKIDHIYDIMIDQNSR